MVVYVYVMMTDTYRCDGGRAKMNVVDSARKVYNRLHEVSEGSRCSRNKCDRRSWHGRTMEVGPISVAAQSVMTRNMHDGQLLPGGQVQRLAAKYVSVIRWHWVRAS